MENIFTDDKVQHLELVLNRGEHSTLIFAQSTSVHLCAKVETDGQLNVFILNFGGSNIAETYNSFNITLAGQNSSTNVYGLSLLDKNQKVYNEIDVCHKSGHTYSRQLFKGIFDDTSQGKFHGHIYVAPAAQKIEATQINRTILVSTKAKFETQPFLEIYADDVKCSHGATIGQFDEQALFYLRSRGIPLKEARQLLMRAFASEITAHIVSVETQNTVNNWIERRLNGETVACGTMPCKHNCISC
ncbi:MAG: SufD family Fe-S cluster assembly protein [Bacteroidales bacterium]|jgi:Fe-S cluster assembly protein SufD|nr:SufD family Fe-S cluster assembly protein [Bacteroidales bacterium]